MLLYYPIWLFLFRLGRCLEMPNSAKLFHITDIIFALTGMQMGTKHNDLEELHSHLLGYSWVPSGRFSEISALRTLLKRQLPRDLAECSGRDLAEFVISLKMQSSSDDFRSDVVAALERKFGKTIAVSTVASTHSDSASLCLLRSLAECPESSGGGKVLSLPNCTSPDGTNGQDPDEVASNRASDRAA